MSLKLFLSHAWKDKSSAVFKAVESKLRGDGYDVWVDKREIEYGESITDALDLAIAEADVVFVLWSRNTHESSACMHEVETALRLRRRLVPCCLDATYPPSEHPALSDHKFLDFSHDAEFALLQMGQFLLRVRNKGNELYEKDADLQSMITTCNETLTELEDLAYRSRQGVSSNDASASYIDSLMQAGKAMIESSGQDEAEKARLIEIFCRIQEIALAHPSKDEDPIKMRKVAEAIDTVDPNGASQKLQMFKMALTMAQPRP